MVAEDRKYTQDHEWIQVADGVGTIGVTEYAAQELGDVVFLELPEAGSRVAKGDAIGTIETVKSVEDLFTPVSGEVAEINQAVLDAPETVNQEPMSGGWLVKISLSDPAELDGLLDAAAYAELIGG